MDSERGSAEAREAGAIVYVDRVIISSFRRAPLAQCRNCLSNLPAAGLPIECVVFPTNRSTHGHNAQAPFGGCVRPY